MYTIMTDISSAHVIIHNNRTVFVRFADKGGNEISIAFGEMNKARDVLRGLLKEFADFDPIGGEDDNG